MSTPRTMTSPRREFQTVRGWRAEFKCWWKMAKYVDVVFDKTRNNAAGSSSICRDCCQLLSTRTCTGETDLTAVGCKFHRKHPDVPFAIGSAITSVRLREMLRPNMAMVFWYIDPDKTDLMDEGWVKRIRENHEETSSPRKQYQHGETCLHGSAPTSILQGNGVEGIYFKRCDGKYLNVLGDELFLDDLLKDHSSLEEPPVETTAEVDETKLAEMAWRKHNPDASEDEVEVVLERKFHCLVM